MYQPWALGAVPLSISDDSQGAGHQQLPQIAVTLLGDATQLLLAPLEFCRGTSPIQAATSLPDLKAAGFGTVAIMDTEVPAPINCAQGAAVEIVRSEATPVALLGRALPHYFA
jgi:hypothetical protein